MREAFILSEGFQMLNSFYDKFIFTNALKYKDNNFFLMNLPFFICPNDLLVGLLESNDPEFEKSFYSHVKNSARNNLGPVFGTDFGFKGEKLVGFMERFFAASGWGLIKNVDLDFAGSRAIVKVSNSPFARQLKRGSAMPVD
ncbi:MAG: hypothetical protein JW744_04665, partial [Candidatus Diapherotrites archaeon]|nr:hypothetical protein [Candidatus Diapherotrites archaeon]